MHICLVNDYPLRYTGGAQTALFQQKTTLEAAGHTVTILQLGTPIPTDASDTIWVRGTVALSPFFNGISDSWVTRRTVDRLVNILRTHHVDIVHLQSELGLSHAVIQAAKQQHIPVFHTIHTFFWQSNLPFQAFLSSVLRLYVRLAYKVRLRPHTSLGEQLKALTLATAQSANIVVSPSQHQRTALIAAGLKTRCIVVPNTFMSRSSQKPYVFYQDQHPITFIWIGRCAPEKRLLEFLAALALVREQTQHPFTVDIVGSGPLLPQAKAFVHTKQLNDTVTFKGNLPHEEVIATLDVASILVLTSYHFDNQPMVVVEAVKRFRGVVYCDERLQEGLSGCGILTKSPHPKDIAKTLIRIIEAPNIAHDLSVKSQKDSLVFSPKRYTQVMTKEYTNAINH